MPSAGFEPAILAIERPQTYALDRTATGIGLYMPLEYVLSAGDRCKYAIKSYQKFWETSEGVVNSHLSND